MKEKQNGQKSQDDQKDQLKGDFQKSNAFETTLPRDKNSQKDQYNNEGDCSKESYENIQPKNEGKKTIILQYPQTWMSQQSKNKNMSKNFARQLRKRIKIIKNNNNDPQIKEMFQKTDVKKFFRTKSDDIGKKKLDDFIQSEAGQIIAQDFFGNCRWIYGLVKENKINVESYFRDNQNYFYETQKAKKTKLN